MARTSLPQPLPGCVVVASVQVMVVGPGHPFSTPASTALDPFVQGLLHAASLGDNGLVGYTQR